MSVEEAARDLEIVRQALQQEGRQDLAARLDRALAALGPADPGTRQDLMTTTEAARALGVRSVNTIKRWAHDGLLTGYRLGGRVLVTRESVDAMLRNAALTEHRRFERELDDVASTFDVIEEDAARLSDLEMPRTGRKPWAHDADART